MCSVIRVEPWAYVLCSTNAIALSSAVVRPRGQLNISSIFKTEAAVLPWYLLGTMVTTGSIITLIGGSANLTFCKHPFRPDYERRTSHSMHSCKSWLCSICVNSNRELAEVHGSYMYSQCCRHNAFSYFLGGNF